MIDDYLESFAGLPVSDYSSGDTEADSADLPPADAVAWRIATGWDGRHSFTELWTRFLDTVAADRVRAVVIGSWWGSDGYSRVRPVLDALIASADRLPGLRGLFPSDVMSEQLGDTGAEALLTGQPLSHLRALDLHHHYLSDAMTRRVCDALEPSGVEVNVAEQEEPDRWDDDDDGEEEEYRYVAVSE